MRWAVINVNTNMVENVIIWDGMSQIFSAQNELLIQLNEEEICEISYLYDSQSDPRFYKQIN